MGEEGRGQGVSPGGRAAKSSVARLGATLEASMGEIRGEVAERLARAEAGVEEAGRVAERERSAYTESLAFLEARVVAEREVARGAARDAEEARAAREAAEREARRAVRRAEDAEQAAEAAERRAEAYAAELAEAEGAVAEGATEGSAQRGLGKEAVGAATSLRGGLAAKLAALAAERAGLREEAEGMKAEVAAERARREAAEAELEGRVKALEAMLGMAGDDNRHARDRLAAMDGRLREMAERSRDAADALLAGLAVAREGALAELDDLRRTPVYVRKTAGGGADTQRGSPGPEPSS